MPTRPVKPGLADSPRQDTQRPQHADHADAGGQEGTTRRAERTQRADATPPAGAPPPAGMQHPDPALPSTGRQAQRPGQHGREQPRPGARDVESLRTGSEEGFGVEDEPKERRDTGVGAEEPPPRRRS